MQGKQAQAREVKLFYLGGLEGRTKNNTVSSADRTFSLPPRGEYLLVPEHVARDLERKHTYIDSANNLYVSLFSRDPRIAKRVRDGFNPFAVDQQPARIILDAAQLSNEELLAQLEARGLLKDALVEDVPDQNDATPAKPTRKKSEPKAPAKKLADIKE